MMRVHRVAAFALAVMALQPFGGVGSFAADYDGPVHRDRHHAFGRAAIGQCVHTRVETIGNTPGASAAVIRYSDGVVQEYDAGMLGQIETRPGDPIQLCLVAFSRDCGTLIPDDQPGRTYATGNLRTGAAWTSPDIRSSCVAR